MAFIISDANILIDFECADLTPRLFQLDIELAVPDLLYHDELSAHVSAETWIRKLPRVRLSILLGRGDARM